MISDALPEFIKLKVHAGSKTVKLEKKAEDSYELWVKAPAQQGKANHAAIELLAGALKRDGIGLRIVKGSSSPSKIVRVFTDASRGLK